METAQEKYLDTKPNWEAVEELRELEKTGYSCLRSLIQERRYGEAEQVLDMLRRVGVV